MCRVSGSYCTLYVDYTGCSPDYSNNFAARENIFDLSRLYNVSYIVPGLPKARSYLYSRSRGYTTCCFLMLLVFLHVEFPVNHNLGLLI